MSLKDFLCDVRPAAVQQERKLLAYIIDNENDLLLHWYPGSGRDFTPLILDVPNNSIGKRLFRVNSGESEDRILLMNDYSPLYEKFVGDDDLNGPIKSDYHEFWGEYGAVASWGGRKEIYTFAEHVITLFTVVVKNSGQGIHDRPLSGDEYVVLFINSVTADLLPIFSEYDIRLGAVFLIKQGGLSGQKIFGHYEKLADKLKGWGLGLGDYWVIDRYGIDDSKRPVCKDLDQFVYVGGPMKWGWPPARIYGRGNNYVRKRRACRIGKSWLS